MACTVTTEELPAAWAAAADDSARIELFARWLKKRRPLGRPARRSAFRLRAQLATLDAEDRADQAREELAGAKSLPPPPPPPPPKEGRSPKRRSKSPAKLPSPQSESLLLRAAYSVHEGSDDIWIFGYGSILWRQGFAFERSLVGYVKGYVRRFHLGDASHRGVSGAPGRAVMLEAAGPEDRCWGCAFLLPAASARRIVEGMDVREASYEKRSLDLFGRRNEAVPVVRDVIAYVVSCCPEKRAKVGYLGPAPVAAIAETIVASRGPSGRNVDYLESLDAWLREHAILDEHVGAVAKAARLLRAAEAEDEARVCEDDCSRPRCAGRVVVDDGAAEVVSNCHRSLLAVGVVRAEGEFSEGDTVAVVSLAGAPIATGRVAYGAADINEIAGKRSRRCAELLPGRAGEPGVVIPKRDMVLS